MSAKPRKGRRMSKPKPSAALLKAIAVTAELTGRVFSPEAAAVFADDLAKFPEASVLKALERCRSEVKGGRGIVQEDVVCRLDDGRPGPDEAWAMLPFDEGISVVWTEEMAASWGIAMPLFDVGDKLGARNAFRETYIAAVARARSAATPPKWSPSLGHSPAGRERALLEAVEKGRMKIEHAQRLYPHLQATPQFERLLGVLEEQPRPEVEQPMARLIARRDTRLLTKTPAEDEAQRLLEAELDARERRRG